MSQRPRALSDEDFERLCENVRRRDRDMIEPVREVKKVASQNIRRPSASLDRPSPLMLALTGPMVSGKNRMR